LVGLAVGSMRAAFVVAGATLAIHRLAVPLESPTGHRSYPTALGDALWPGPTVVEAMGRTVLLAAPAMAMAIVGGVVAAALSRTGPARAVGRSLPGLGSGLILAVAVPGLAWLPLVRLAVDDGPVPADPDVIERVSGDAVLFLGFWAALVGLAVAPTVAAALGRARAWELRGSGGHPAMARLASGPLTGRGRRLAVPTATLALALAGAEVASGLPGLFGRFFDEVAAGRTDLLVPLALPVVVGGGTLALLVDLSNRLLDEPEPVALAGTPGGAPVPAGRRRRAATVATAVLAALVAAVAASGAVIDPLGAPSAPLAAPHLGGPWLGTDGGGFDLARRAASAVGPGLVASVVPAAAASLVGAGLALFRRAGGRLLARAVDTVLELLWWPAALVVPLTAGAALPSDQPLLDPTVLQATGLLLVPAATRLLHPRAGSFALGAARLAAVTTRLAAMALAAHVLAGFVVPAAVAEQAPLGQLLAEGWRTSPGSPWPVVVPAAAAAAVATALLWTSATLAGRVSGDRLATPAGVAGVSAPDDLSLAGLPRVDDDPERSERARQETLVIRLGAAEEDGPVTAPSTPPTVAPAPGRAGPSRPDVGPGDIRAEISIESAVDIEPLDSDAEREASQTIELRPSDFWRGGAGPSG
jgi:hypothetical protein